MKKIFSMPFLEQIQEKLSYINPHSLEIIEPNQVLDSNNTNTINTISNSQDLHRYLVIPDSKAILSQFLSICNEQGWVILPMGNGTKIHWGKPADNYHLMVSTKKLNGIIDHAVEDLTVTVESGMKIKDLQDFLALKGQFLPIDPCFPDFATIGGIVATGNTGSWRQRYGGVRDLLLGISFLRGDGKEAKGGGKVVKNVAGYDLMKLFTGSYGNLGVITDVTFRTFPLPENSLTLVMTGDKESIYQLQKTLLTSGLTPTMADLISPSLVKTLDLASGFGLLLRFQGIAESVAQQCQQIQQWSSQLNLFVKTYENQGELELWRDLPQKVHVVNSPHSVTCKVGILPSEVVNLMEKIEDFGLINISYGIGYLCFNDGIKSHQLMNLRQFCEDKGGFLSILNASLSFKKQIEPWGYVGNSLKMMETIKQNFDPNHIFCHRI